MRKLKCLVLAYRFERILVKFLVISVYNKLSSFLVKNKASMTLFAEGRKFLELSNLKKIIFKRQTLKNY